LDSLGFPRTTLHFPREKHGILESCGSRRNPLDSVGFYRIPGFRAFPLESSSHPHSRYHILNNRALP